MNDYIKMLKTANENNAALETQNRRLKVIITERESTIDELEKKLKETKNVIVAHQTADADGYIDGYGWVANWSEMEEGMVNLFEAHNLEQQAKGILDLLADKTRVINGRTHVVGVDFVARAKALKEPKL
jgi:predicted RNA-binding protein with PIN domain